MLLAVFAFGFASGVATCARGDGDHGTGVPTEHHCVLHCGCHLFSLNAVGPAGPQPELQVKQSISTNQKLKLPLFAASIFNPPKG
jgi:hypothetical protein